MKMIITKEQAENILTTYYKSKEDIDGKVEMKTTKEQVGYYTYNRMAAVTTFELSGTTSLLGTEISVKRTIPVEEYEGIFKNILQEQGYELTNFLIDSGIRTFWTGYGFMEREVEETYCNGIKLEVKPQVKELKR